MQLCFALPCLAVSNFPCYESGQPRSNCTCAFRYTMRLHFCDETSMSSPLSSSFDELQCTDSLTAHSSEVVTSQKKGKYKADWMTQYLLLLAVLDEDEPESSGFDVHIMLVLPDKQACSY